MSQAWSKWNLSCVSGTCHVGVSQGACVSHRAGISPIYCLVYTLPVYMRM